VRAISFARDTGESAAFINMFATISSSATVQNQANTLYRVLVGRLTSIAHNAALKEDGSSYVLDDSVFRRFRQREIGLYAQDSWRLRPNLTLNFGLREEVAYAPISQNKGLTKNTFAGLFGVSGTDLSALFKPGATGGSLTQFNPLPQGEHLYNTTYNLAPTFGFAYQPNFKHGFLRRLAGNSGQTVLRGGWSMAFAREGLNLTDSIVGANFGGTVPLTQVAGSPTGFPRGTLFSGLPVPPATPGAPAYPLTPGVFDQAAANGYLPNLKMPRVISFSGSIQREISKDTVIEIGYVGNRGHQLLRQFNLNEINIVENGFANEFNLARQNLAANIAAGRCQQTSATNSTPIATLNCQNNFGYYGPGTGTFPLPLFLAYFAGLSGAANINNPANYNATFANFRSTTYTNGMTASSFGALGIAGTLNNPNNGLTGNAITAGQPANLFIVNPQMALNGSFLVNNDGKTWYDAVTVDVRRRMSKGVLFDFNYSFSKALGNEYVSSSIAFLQPATLRNTALNKVVSPFDIRQSLKGSWIVELPTGRGKKFMGDAHGLRNSLVGDWTLNGTLRVSSGVPMNLGNVQLVNMTAKQLEDSIRIRKDPNHLIFWLPDDIIQNTKAAFGTCIPGTKSSSGVVICSPAGYVNAAGNGLGDPSGRYIAPAGLNCISSFTGQCGYTQLILHGPPFARVDIGIEKRFKISETKNIELRFEFLNALNNIDWRLGSYQGDTYTIGGAQSGTTPVPTFTDSRFGQLTGPETAYRDTSTTNDPGGRVGQIVFRFNF